MQPDRLGNQLREIPRFGQAFACQGMIQTDDAPFYIRQIAAGQRGHFDDAGEGFRHGGIERDLADVMQEAADEGIGGAGFGFGARGEQLGGRRHRQ